MNRMSVSCALLACVVMSASGVTHAQGRNPKSPDKISSEQAARKQDKEIEVANRGNKRPEMDAWLRRLVGRFSIEGALISARGTGKVLGTADCIGIGEGPGVHCILNVTYKTIHNHNEPVNLDTYNVMRPLVMLYGIDPESQMIKVLWVDNHSEGRTGALKDDAVMFPLKAWEGCDAHLTHCWGGSLVTAKPGGQITLKFNTAMLGPDRFELRLNREMSPR